MSVNGLIQSFVCHINNFNAFFACQLALKARSHPFDSLLEKGLAGQHFFSGCFRAVIASLIDCGTGLVKITYNHIRGRHWGEVSCVLNPESRVHNSISWRSGAGAHVGRGTLVLLFKQACVNLFKSDRRMPHRRRTQPQNGDDRGRRTKDGGWWMVAGESRGWWMGYRVDGG